MRLTNQLGLPGPIVNAVSNDEYEKGDCDFSTTGLIAPVRIQALKQRHGSELVEDAADCIFSLFGKAMHTVLERAADPRYHLVEKRYYADFAVTFRPLRTQIIKNHYRVGGRFDLMDYLIDTETHTLSDYKFTSHYAVGDGVKPEWKGQLNVNAFILKKNGFNIEKLQIVAIFRDWSKLRAIQKEDYPSKQVAILPVEMWPMEKTEAFIKGRIKAHVEGSENPPVCSPEERWHKPDKWALMKKGAKRAIKLFDTKSQADAAVMFNNGTVNPRYYTEERLGDDVRCKHYCEVWKYCDYGRLVREA